MAIQLLRGATTEIYKSPLDVQPGQPLYVTDRNYLAINGGKEAKNVKKLNLIRVKELGGYFKDTLELPEAGLGEYSIAEETTSQTIENKTVYTHRLKLTTTGYNDTRVTLQAYKQGKLKSSLEVLNDETVQINAKVTTLGLESNTTDVSKVTPNSLLLSGFIYLPSGQPLVDGGSNINVTQTEINLGLNQSSSSNWVYHYGLSCPTVSVYTDPEKAKETPGYKIWYVDVLPESREPNSIYIVKEYTDTSNWV